MKVRFDCALATPAQCSEGTQAACAVFEAAGLSPLAARNAFAEVSGAAACDMPSPASVRAARTWSRAVEAAVHACFGDGPVSVQARLDLV